MSLAGLEYTTIKEISGPLLFVESVRGVGYGELARIRTPSGKERRGQVLEIGGGVAVVQVFEGTTGLDVGKTQIGRASCRERVESSGVAGGVKKKEEKGE